MTSILKNILYKLIPGLVLVLLCGLEGAAQQVGIGTHNPDPSAVLDISSTTKGVIAPRLTTAEKNAIANPAAGLVVYDSDLKIYTYYDGTEWVAPDAITTVPPPVYSVMGYPDINTPTGTAAQQFQAVTVGPVSVVNDSGDGIIGVSGNQVTILQGGTYIITASGVFRKTVGTSNIKAKINILKNGVLISETYFHFPDQGVEVHRASKTTAVLENLAAGDIILFQIQKENFQSSNAEGRHGEFSNLLLEIEKIP